MRIAIGNDHRGTTAKAKVSDLLKRLGHEVVNLGVDCTDSVDYPDVAIPVAEQVAAGKTDRGILVCGSGIGMCIAANKVRGIRAALCHDELTAEMSRRHNDANVLCLSGDMLSDRVIDRLVETWLNTEFEGGRHARRLEKIAEVERRCGQP